MDTNLSKFWETVMDRGAWHAAIHGVAKSQTWLCDWTTFLPFQKRVVGWNSSSKEEASSIKYTNLLPETVAALSKSPLPGPRSPRCQVKTCLSRLARNYLNSTYKGREGNTQKCPMRDFPGGPLIKTSPSNAGGAGSISGQRTRIPHASQRKN